jgi:hypothetical protein
MPIHVLLLQIFVVLSSSFWLWLCYPESKGSAEATATIWGRGTQESTPVQDVQQPDRRGDSHRHSGIVVLGTLAEGLLTKFIAAFGGRLASPTPDRRRYHQR